MHYLLSKLLAKRGYKNISELSADRMPDGSPSEKETFDRWNKVLSARDTITVEDIKKFCNGQVQHIEQQWKSLDNATVKNERLVLLHTVYKAIIEVIDSPQTQRESLEKYLMGLL